MLQSVQSFIEYFEGVRRRTLRYVRVIPADSVEWMPKEGEFTCGEIVRHIAAAEEMFVGVVIEGRWRYPGHDAAPHSSLDVTLARLDTCHAQAMARLSELPDEALYQPRPTLNGPPVKARRLLMVMVEHEVHHRSQLAVYLALLGV
ncbi:MAG TPA: DinB family protein, partial [Ardenticatenaceae bacterium]